MFEGSTNPIRGEEPGPGEGRGMRTRLGERNEDPVPLLRACPAAHAGKGSVDACTGLLLFLLSSEGECLVLMGEELELQPF